MLAAMMGNCGKDFELGLAHRFTRNMVDATNADVVALQGQVNTLAGRTGVVEVSAKELHVTVKALPGELAEEFGTLLALKADKAILDAKIEADAKAKKANRRELRKYAQNVRQRVEAVEQEVAAIRAAPVSTQLGTIVIVPRLEPVYFGEE